MALNDGEPDLVICPPLLTDLPDSWTVGARPMNLVNFLAAPNSSKPTNPLNTFMNSVETFSPINGYHHYIRMSVFSEDGDIIAIYRSDRDWDESTIYYNHITDESGETFGVYEPLCSLPESLKPLRQQLRR